MQFCPASMTGKTLSPKHFMEGLRDQINMAETAIAAAASAQRAAKGGANGGVEAADASLSLARDRAREALSLPIVDHAIPEEAVWQCTTCGWCVEGCPVLIEHVDSIVEIRRNLVLEEGSFPKELNAAFRNMETAGNPWGQPKSARLDWAKGLDVSVLGQTDAPRPPAADGGPGRTIHASNGEGTILYWVGCAGAFDDRNRRVVRAMAQLLDRLVADGRLVPTEHHDAVIAYHDACYLGRYNQVYDEGRRVVESVPGQQITEMELHHRRGMCCGAGGARMWMEEREGQRINHRRVEHALATDASAIATACPFCLIMLRDGVTDLERTDVAVSDVAELLAAATGAWADERTVSDGNDSLIQ
jgi:Fe-S oxidoreductase